MLAFYLLACAGIIGYVSFRMLPNFHEHWAQWHDLAVEYADGLAYYHRRKWLTLRWEEVAEVTRRTWSEISRLRSGDSYFYLYIILALLFGESRRYSIRAVGADPIRIGGTLKGVEGLINRIERRTLCHREERAITALQTGIDVQFGSVSVNLGKGINRGGKWHAWQSVTTVGSDVGIESTTDFPPLSIFFKGGFWGGSIDARDFPNGDVLYSLAARRDDWIRLNATEIVLTEQDDTGLQRFGRPG